jgi:hypothetical protein
MTKKQLIEEITLNPSRYYRAPSDVVRDRRFNDEERLKILEAWERDARALAVADEESMTGGEPSRLHQVAQARLELEKKVPGETIYRESSKFGGGPVE